MPREYTPSGSPIAYTVPAYADVVDGPTAFKSFADDVATGLAAKVAYPSGGSDGQALVKSGAAAAWGSAGALVLVNKTDFAAASSVILNNVFSSTYDDYVVALRFTGTANGHIDMRYRAAGVDANGANYQYGTFYVNNSTAVPTGLSNGTNLTLTHLAQMAASWAGFMVANICGPALARATDLNASGVYDTNGMWAYCRHALATAYDGLTLLPQAGTITGTVRVYGLQKA